MEDEKKKLKSGTFTQIPNVFFDTCSLPESAQILYLRLYRNIAYKDGSKFVGSIRKLSSLVRLSKSTVERMLKKLEESRLISVGSELSLEQDRTVMTITLNPQELWILNKQHYEDGDVPNWDKVMPDAKVLSQIGTKCPESGQHDINLGQSDVTLGQTVPDVSSKDGTISISTSNNLNTEEEQSDLNQNQSSGKKPIGAFYLEPCIKDLLKSADEYWDRRKHTKRLAQIYLECTLEDEELFKSIVISASKEAMKHSNSLEHFYRCLCSSLHLEEAK